MPRAGTGRRSPLRRERVVVAAVQIADEHGVTGVTMRAVAARLGVEAMSLYHHVSGRDDVLDGMIDTVLAEVDLPASGEPWREAMRARATSTRAALSRHPWAVGLLDSRSTPGPATLRHHDAVLGILREARFSVRGAVRAFSIVDSYLYGYVLQELNLPFSDAEQMDDVARGLLHDQVADTYPHLAEVVSSQTFMSAWDADTEFEAGLTLVLDALEPDGS
ncbi:TetR/AcrR family transcriptional regulator C-terminal domain-containing protein [Aeromicrobium sp. CTD01-1L150]|uniref:TetR/AcrR family transcriptional regulator C-terminal domain-containing protein n=1 Tax=Aeromicrobium sp. CTD01-1L150 TaxID=3341830 RepID=UPI0035C0C0EE